MRHQTPDARGEPVVQSIPEAAWNVPSAQALTHSGTSGSTSPCTTQLVGRIPEHRTQQELCFQIAEPLFITGHCLRHNRVIQRGKLAPSTAACAFMPPAASTVRRLHPAPPRRGASGGKFPLSHPKGARVILGDHRDRKVAHARPNFGDKDCLREQDRAKTACQARDGSSSARSDHHDELGWHHPVGE